MLFRSYGTGSFSQLPFSTATTAAGPVNSGTLAVTLDDVVVAASGAVVHGEVGNLALTLDDVVIASSGVVNHTGSLTLTLGDIVPAFSGIEGHTGTLAATLGDISFASSGTVSHAGGETGSLVLALDDIAISMLGDVPITTVITKGGISPKRKKNQAKEIEQLIQDILEPKQPELIEEKPEITLAPAVEYIDKSPDIKAQIDLIVQQIETLDLAELDDEETILLLM